jgi:hypothetical protein
LWETAINDPEWFSLKLKASQTGILDEYELASARTQMTAEQYAAEYECSFAGSIVGAYYGPELERLEAEGKMDGVGWDPAHKVSTAWDVGNTTAIWFFQEVRGEIRIIDYLEGLNEQPSWYVEQLKNKRRYAYDVHIMPDDATRGKEIIGLSWEQSLEQVGITGTYILPAQTSVDAGINAAKVLMMRCSFHGENTKHGVQALRNYRRKWDDRRKTFHDTALHDWSSHGADAFRYLAIGINSMGGHRKNWTQPIKYNTNWVI